MEGCALAAKTALGALPVSQEVTGLKQTASGLSGRVGRAPSPSSSAGGLAAEVSAVSRGAAAPSYWERKRAWRKVSSHWRWSSRVENRSRTVLRGPSRRGPSPKVGSRGTSG
eukprot:scaffold304379_cov27-Tisochrysis_lutea.AAC.5